MKRYLFVTVLILGVLSSGAQDFFSVGPRIGYNANTLSGNRDSITASIQNSFQFGAFLRLGNKIYLQPEISYQVVSGNMQKTTDSYLFSQQYKLKTIKVPALIGVKLLNNSIMNFRIMAGPAFTWNINKNLSPSIVNDLWPIRSTDDLKNSFWSLQAGAGIDVLFLSLDVRYEWGIENMYQGKSDFELKNNIFNVSLGVKFL